MGLQVNTTANDSVTRTTYIAESKSGELWKPSEWKKIVHGQVRTGYVFRDVIFIKLIFI
jgi:hypothetical protein